jgi:hypothetical protein
MAVAGVQAQAPSKVEVNVPFEFTAGKATLKPGVYSIRRMSGNLLALRSADGKSVILNAPQSLSSSDPKAEERLVFDKYGDKYVLSQIWLTVDTGRQLFVEKKGANPQRIEIALRTRKQ